MTSERAAKTTVNPHGMHLVGSVPLSDSGAVYRCVCDIAAEHIRRLPDGETGARRLLAVVATERRGRICVVTAYDPDAGQRRDYMLRRIRGE